MPADVCKHKRWSLAEDQQLRELVQQHRTSAQAAHTLGRTVKSVEARRSYLKLRANGTRLSTGSDIEQATKRALAALDEAYRVTHGR